MDNHGFCRILLAECRKDADRRDVPIPSNLVALRSDKDTWFVQGKNDQGKFCDGDCAYSAKAAYISKVIDEVNPETFPS